MTVTELAVVSDKPLKVISFPPFVIVTWSDVRVSIDPSEYVIEYFSESNGSKKALVIPTDASSPAWVFIDKEELATFWFVICLLITKLELDVSTLEITPLGNTAYMPEFSIFKTLGTLILNVEVVAVTVPVLTPTTGVVVPRVKTLPAFAAGISDIVL